MPIPIIPGSPGSPDDQDPRVPPIPPDNVPLITDQKLGIQRQLNIPPLTFVYPVRQHPLETLKFFDKMFMEIRIKAEAVFRQNYQRAKDEDPAFKKFAKKQEKKIMKRMN